MVARQAVHDLVIVQGADFAQVFQIADGDGVAIDITGFTITAVARVGVGLPIIVTFTVGFTDATNGEITLTLTAAQTAAFTFDKLVYDVRYQDVAGAVSSHVGGTVTLDELVTTT